WDGFWEFPTMHLAGADPAGRAFQSSVDLAEGVRRLSGVEARIGPVVQRVRYSVTKHRVDLEAHAARAVPNAADPVPGPGLVQAVWETAENLVNYPFSAAGRRLVAWVRKSGSDVLEREADD